MSILDEYFGTSGSLLDEYYGGSAIADYFDRVREDEDDPWWRDYLIEPAQSFAASTVSLPGRAIRGLEVVSPVPLGGLAEPFESAAEAVGPEDEPENFMQEVARGVGSALPDLAAIIAAGSATGGAALPIALGGGLAAGASHQEALARGVDPMTARAKALAEGVGSGALEAIGGGAVRRALRGVGRGATAVSRDAVPEGTLQRLMGLAAGKDYPLLDVAQKAASSRAVTGGLGEGATEALQEIYASGLEAATGKEMDLGDVGRRALLAGTTGGIIGAGAGALARAHHMTPEEKAQQREVLKRWLTVENGLPDYAFEAVERQGANFTEATLAAGYLANDLNNAQRLYLAKNPNVSPNELGDKLYRWLQAPPPDLDVRMGNIGTASGDRVVSAVPEEFQPILRDMRALQDDISRRIYNEPDFLTEGQKKTFAENFGKYLRRSYAIHDDPNHIERLKGGEIWNNARDHIAKTLRDEAQTEYEMRLARYNARLEERRIAFDERALRKQTDPDVSFAEVDDPYASFGWNEARSDPYRVAEDRPGALDEAEFMTSPRPVQMPRKMAEPEAPNVDWTREADRILEQMVERSRTDADIVDPFESAFSAGDMGRADLAIMRHRKDLEEPILKVLGEYTDPSVAFTKSVARAMKTLTTRQMYREIRDGGWMTDIFPEEGAPGVPVERFSTEIFPGEGDRLQAIIGEEGPAVAQVRGVKGPLAGLYTRKDLADTLALASEHASTSALQMMNGLVKWGFTVGSPQAQVRNVWSNTLALVANGNLILPFTPWGNGAFKGTRKLMKAMKTTRSGLMITDYDKVREGADERREMYREAAKYGLVGKNADLGDVNYYLGKWAEEKGQQGGVLGQILQSRAASLPQKYYQFGDDSFKVAAWWAETEKYRWAGLSEAEAKTRAAEVVKQTLQNYDRQPGVVKAARRVPFFGPFVSFPAAVMINGKNTVKLGLQEIRDPNAKIRTLGAYRLGGFASALALPGAVAAMLEKQFGAELSEEEEAAVQEFIPFYAKNSQRAYVSKGMGQVKVMDVSFMDYWAQLKKPLIAALRSKGDESALAAAFGALSEPLRSEEPVFGALMDLIRNRDIYGQEVRNPAAPIEEQVVDSVRHVAYMNAPGALRTATRMYRGYTGWEDENGRAYDFGTEAMALVGPRMMDLDFGRAVEGRGRWFKHGKGKASKEIRQITENHGKMSEKEIRDQARVAHHVIHQTYKGMLDGISAARTMGVSEEDLRYYLGPEGSRLGSNPMITGTTVSETDLLLSGTWTAEEFANLWMRQKLEGRLNKEGLLVGGVNEARRKELERHLERERRKQNPSAERMQRLRDRWVDLTLDNLYD